MYKYVTLKYVRVKTYAKYCFARKKCVAFFHGPCRPSIQIMPIIRRKFPLYVIYCGKKNNRETAAGHKLSVHTLAG